MLLPPESSSAVHVMMSSKSVPICNYSHGGRVNTGKNNNDFLWSTLFDALFEANPFTQWRKFGRKNLWTLFAGFTSDRYKCAQNDNFC